MPTRKTPLVTNETYHIINRGISAVPIFKTKYDYKRFLQTILYYQNVNPPIKFSKLISLGEAEKNKILEQLKKKESFWVEIIAYCLMPNHYHLLLKQIKDNGIINFIGLLSNSYAHYFNTKYRRTGSLFEGRFKAIRVETDAQLLHLSRYIHLNPYSSFLVKDFESLLVYPYSSLPEYLGKGKPDVCHKNIVLDQFKNSEAYKKFVLDQADYQRTLQEIKHQVLES